MNFILINKSASVNIRYAWQLGIFKRNIHTDVQELVLFVKGVINLECLILCAADLYEPAAFIRNASNSVEQFVFVDPNDFLFLKHG